MKQNAKNAAKLCRNIKRASSDWAKLLLHKGLRQRRDKSNKLNVWSIQWEEEGHAHQKQEYKSCVCASGSITLYLEAFQRRQTSAEEMKHIA